MRASRWILLGLLVLAVWYRAHTFGPSVRAAVGFDLWPRTIGESEPLDCDEAAYASIGRRILTGDVLYRDVTENKPPLGYWVYAAAVALGGYRELAIRLLPYPFILATIALVWRIAARMGGRLAAPVAAWLFIMLSTDPYLFGNGADFEHIMNCFSVAVLALLASERPSRRLVFAAGVCLGLAVLVKQVAIVQALPAVLFLAMRRKDDPSAEPSLARRAADVLALALGVAATAGAAALVLTLQGAGAAAFDDIFRYGRALATDTLPEPGAPSPLIRWLTGNADPQGRLPSPFGSTDYLVWWGTGSWPTFLASVPAVFYLLFHRGSSGTRRLAAGWTLAAWAEVVLPGLYWPHYYLLPTPGVAIAVAVALADAAGLSLAHATRRRIAPALAVIGLATACAGETYLQARDYLWVAPEELTIRYKGGRQWVVLRSMGRQLAARARLWRDPRLYIWGWQSPLHFYSRLDSPTRHFFVDNLLRDQADRDHPLIKPRTEEIARVLRAHPPQLIFTGYPPFRELRAILDEHYLPSSTWRGLWILREDYGRFEIEGEADRGVTGPRAPR